MLRLVPPVIAKDSLRRSISSDPLSPVTVNPVPTGVVAEVIRPLESTVITGTSDPEPYDPAETPLAARVIGEVMSPVPSNVCPESVVASPETVILAFAKENVLPVLGYLLGLQLHLKETRITS